MQPTSGDDERLPIDIRVVARMNDLLLEIARCPEVKRCLATEGHPCARVVGDQTELRAADRQVPEPWNGDLRRAPILFVSSNPSISATEAFPRGRSSDGVIARFFEGRFGTAADAPIHDGARTLMADGTRSRAVRFLSSIRLRAAELLDRAPVPGRDYALTEVVHCKSRGERGVEEARGFCAERYLTRVLAASGAVVVVVLGAHARRAMAEVLDLRTGGPVAGPLEAAGRARFVAILPHPNARGVPKSLAANVGSADLARLRGALAAWKAQTGEEVPS